MKFHCNSCKTKYSISDEKVRGKILKIRCKKCKNIIVLRETSPDPGAEPESKKAAKAKSPSSAFRSKKTVPEKKAARSPASAQVKSAQSKPAQTKSKQSFKQFDKLIDRNLDSSAATAAATSPAPSPAPSQPQVVWYLAIRGKQSPPLDQATISKKIRHGEVGAKAYAWNQNMPNWLRLAEVKEFAPDFKWLKRAGSDGKVVDFQKKVAERRRQEARAKRKPALNALDQIADLVTPGPEAFADEPAPRDESTRAQTEQADPPDEAEDFFFNPSSIDSFGGEGVAKPGEEAMLPTTEGSTGPTEAFDPFALAPDAMIGEEPRRESTRIFVARAGLVQRQKKQRVYAIFGAVVGVLLVGTIALDALGVIRIPILHYYVETVKVTIGNENKTKPEPKVVEESVPLTEEEKAAIRDALMTGNKKKAAEVRRRAHARAHKQRGLNVDLSGHNQGTGTSSAGEGNRRTGGSLEAIDLTPEEKNELASLSKLEDRKKISIRVKPGLGDIKLPTKHRGGLKAKQISKVVVEGQKGVAACATSWTKSGDELPNALNVTVTIANSGRVSQALVNEIEYRNMSLGRCLTRTVKNWRFPEFTGRAMDVEIPFKFTTVH